MTELILAEGGCSVVEDLDGNSRATNVNAVQRHQSEHARTKSRLCYIGGLHSHMQSMGERLSKLEQERLPPDLHQTPQGIYYMTIVFIVSV